MSDLHLSGAFVAIVTPFTKDNEVDYRALENLVEWQIESGISGIVPCGTTGESVSLSEAEYEKVISTVVEKVNGRVQVIGGAGGNNTDKTIKLAKMVSKTGVDAILSVCPYYNKPTQEGLYQHFKAIADASDLPVVLYNVPGRTSVNMLPQTTLRLAEHSNIIAVKEASANLVQIMEIIKNKPSGFNVLSGDDQLALHLIASGGDGVISVVANQVPGDYSAMIKAAIDGDFKQALKLQYKLLDLMNVNFIETSPIPVKTSLALAGKIEEVFRLPLTKISDDHRSILKTELEKLNLI